VIGASAGGQRAIKEVLRTLPEDLPAAVILMQHLSEEAASGVYTFADWLSSLTPLPTVFIQSGQRPQSGRIYVGPPGCSVPLNERRLEVSATPRRTRVPAVTINALFESAAQEFGDRVIGVILTGLLKDGTNGLKAVHEAGGLTIVQDPTEAEYPDMPASAMQDLPVTFCLSLAEIGPTLELLARRQTELGPDWVFQSARSRSASPCSYA
jgi:two-component system chemotaxis response regulator CheB